MKRVLMKLGSFIVTLFFVSVIAFLLFQIIPGDSAVAKLGSSYTEEAAERMREASGYYDPLPVRFAKWLFAAVKGDFGYSDRYTNMKVSELMKGRLSVTVWLAVYSLVLIGLLGIPLGLMGAKKPGSLADRVTDLLGQITMATPSFVMGILVTLVFGVILNAFTPGAYVDIKDDPLGFFIYLFFPALSVALPKIGSTVKFLKSTIRREQKKDYVRTAKAKGNTLNAVMWQHVFQNSLLPVITYVGLIGVEVLAGSVMVEQIFNLPGLGRLLVTSISNRDFNVVQAIVMYTAVIVLFLNAFLDKAYRMLDPRLR